MRTVSKALGAILAATALAGLSTAAAVSATSADAATTAGAAATAKVATAADSPAGFNYGTDSWPTSVELSNPYREPVIWGPYGGYVGMAGNWARTEGCRTGNFLAWSSANSAQADTNYAKYHIGIGTGVYWYMGGPGVDPHWNGTVAEAAKWGAAQAADALAAMKKLHVTYPVVWADIELPGIEPALDNGWNSVYSSPCSEVKIRTSVPAAVDRAEFNGFANYITTHSTYKVGVYSSAPVWDSIFGTGSTGSIPNTYEWTYLPETSQVTFSTEPTGWCLHDSRTCAQFFGGQSSSSKYALMWQWSGGGGITNRYGFDFDQIDTGRLK
jgi:hypothetical protein